MKKRIRKISLGIFSVIAFIMAAAGSYTINGQVLGQTFELGFGTIRPMISDTNLRVPAATHIRNVYIILQRNPAGSTGAPVADIPVRIELSDPQGDILAEQRAVAGNTPSLSTIENVSEPGFFTSQQGCEDKWRIRIRAENGLAAPARVFGTIAVIVSMPPLATLHMLSAVPPLLASHATTRALNGTTISGSTPVGIVGTGKFAIRARWERTGSAMTPGSQVLVQLLKPNGTVANHATGASTQVEFDYKSTSVDAAMTGTWKIRVRNLSGPSVTNFRIDDSNFRSSFFGACTPPPSLGP